MRVYTIGMGLRGLVILFALARAAGLAQTVCGPTLTYSPCDIMFEMTEAEAQAHPNPYLTIELHGEFRSPSHRTYLMPAFWNGARTLVIRVAPTEPGAWDFRLTSNIERFNAKMGSFTATPSNSPGFVKTANVHHFAYTEGHQPHLWMGDACDRFAFLPVEAFQKFVDARAGQKFNHLRGIVIGRPEDAATIWHTPDQPDPAYFRRVDECIRYMNQKGITADLVLAGGHNDLTKLFPTWQQRERYVRYLVSRYSAMNITWQGVEDFEDYENGRELLKEIGLLLKKEDPYQHLRSAQTRATSSPLLDDGWMDYITTGSPADEVGAIEHQLYPVPFVHARTSKNDRDASRRLLWNHTMNGEYVTYGNCDDLDSAAAKQMAAWFNFISGTRHWELEPYFDVDGGRALALEDVEYIVYVEKPSGPVEVLVEKHGYDVAWLNPITGESIKQKDFKGEKFIGTPPDNSHDWVLHISREGRKESMLRSYKFESRPIVLQEIELNPQKVPFEIEQPAADTVSQTKPPSYGAKLKRETHATRTMMYLWTGEVAADNQGYRVLGTGAKGTFQIPGNIAKHYPAVLHLHVAGMNANGKVYTADRTYQLTK